MAKNYATESDIITIPDPVFGPGTKVNYTGKMYRVAHSQWDTLKQTWTYALSIKDYAQRDYVVMYLGEVPESELVLEKP